MLSYQACFALPPPLLGELAERLVEQQQGDAVFAAGIAGLLEDLHVAEPGHLIEQEQDAPLNPAIRLVGGIEQGADDDAAEGRGELQHPERDLYKHGQLALGELSGLERIPGDQLGVGGRREPTGVLVGVGVNAGEGLLDQAHQGAGEITGHGAGRVPVHLAEQHAHFVFGGDEQAPQRLQRLLLRRQLGVPEQVASRQVMRLLPDSRKNSAQEVTWPRARR